MNILSGKWRWFKIGLLLVLLLLVGYFGPIWLDKRAQWQVFLELEQEQLAIVTADGFIEREFGMDPSNRVRIAPVSSYARYTGDYADRIYDEGAVRAFLSHAPEPKFDDFTLTYSQGLGSASIFAYPVSWCGDRYCEFNAELTRNLGDYRFEGMPQISRSFSIEKDDYIFEVWYSIEATKDENVRLLNISIGSEPRNLLDRFWAEILQIPSGYSIETIYRVDYVTGWSYFRKDMQDG